MVVFVNEENIFIILVNKKIATVYFLKNVLKFLNITIYITFVFFNLCLQFNKYKL